MVRDSMVAGLDQHWPGMPLWDTYTALIPIHSADPAKKKPKAITSLFDARSYRDLSAECNIYATGRLRIAGTIWDQMFTVSLWIWKMLVKLRKYELAVLRYEPRIHWLSWRQCSNSSHPIRVCQRSSWSVSTGGQAWGPIHMVDCSIIFARCVAMPLIDDQIRNTSQKESCYIHRVDSTRYKIRVLRKNEPNKIVRHMARVAGGWRSDHFWRAR